MAGAVHPPAAAKDPQVLCFHGKKHFQPGDPADRAGQTVSSNFGTIDSAQYNMEQLLNAGISNELFSDRDVTVTVEEEKLLDALANESFKAYTELKNHPDFMSYLSISAR